MYGNKPLSKFGCKNQANDWRSGHNLSNQVLSRLIALGILFSSAFSFSEIDLAEIQEEKQQYYTWVDAQGVVHSTPIASRSSTSTKSSSNSRANNNDILDKQASRSGEEYLTEEKHQEKLKKELAGKKPFFTWTDAQGVIRSEVKPDVLVDFVAEEIVYDAVFAPPFRLPEHITQGVCCEDYAEAFSAVVKLNGSASYQVERTYFSFKTQTENVAAAYFSLPNLAAKEIVLLKAYKIPKETRFEIIALDTDFKPMYLASDVKGIYVEQTWKDLAYKKTILEVSDRNIKYLVVFTKSNNKALASYRVSVLRDQLID